jgi:O-antigen ligase
MKAEARPFGRLMSACVALLALGCFFSHSLATITFSLGLLLVAHKAWRQGPSSLISLPGMNAALALYAASFVVSSFFGIDPEMSVPFITELKRILVAYVVANSLEAPEDFPPVFGAIALGASVSTAYALYQHYVGGNYRTLQVTHFYRPREMLSSFAFSSTSNDFGALLATAFGLFAAPFFFGNVSRYQRILLGILTGWLGVGLLRSGCRSALVGVVLGTVVVGLAVKPRRLLYVALAGLLIIPVLPRSLTTRFPGFFDSRNPSNRYRIRMFKAAVEMAHVNLPIGIGRHNFEPLFHRMHPNELRTPNAHNNYLNVLVEQGVGGLIGLVWFQLALFLYLGRRFSDALHANWFIGLFMAIFAFSVAGLSIFDWGYSLPVTLMWVLVGTAVAAGERCARPAQASSLENR